MNIIEYNKVKDLHYSEYCDYLQNKYGIGRSDYMTPAWNKKPTVTRSSEGLFAHHKYEDHAVMLAEKEYAMKNPFKWQLAENIVYCDYLEHLFLHILICENPSENRNENEAVGIGGITKHIVPVLNDYYSGREAKMNWQRICLDVVKNDKNVYLLLLKRFKESCCNYPLYTKDCLLSCHNDKTWNKSKNKEIFAEIMKL